MRILETFSGEWTDSEEREKSEEVGSRGRTDLFSASFSSLDQTLAEMAHWEALDMIYVAENKRLRDLKDLGLVQRPWEKVKKS
jgi:hypothetical protein